MKKEKTIYSDLNFDELVDKLGLALESVELSSKLGDKNMVLHWHEQQQFIIKEMRKRGLRFKHLGL